MPIKLLANEHTTTTIFFPSSISKTIAPGANYKFEYREDDPSIGLLKARKGSSSNLTVITDAGYIYSFVLSYSETIENFNFVLSSDMAVGRVPGRQSPSERKEESIADTSLENSDDSSKNRADISPEVPKSRKEDTMVAAAARNEDDGSAFEDSQVHDEKYFPEADEASYSEGDEASFSEGGDDTMAFGDGEGDLYDIDREEYYRIYCENNYLQKTLVRRTFRQNKRIVLKLNNILVDRDEIFFILQIENNSKKEYLVNGLSFFKKSGVGQLQKIMKPLYTYNLQDKIDPQSINELVYVFKRFTISSKEEVYVVLDELENNRLVMLPLDNKSINAPTN